MINVKQYKVTCLKCKQFNIVPIADDRSVMWKNADRIISARYRLDNQWGFECFCQNNDIMTEQEKQMIKNHQQPEPKELSAIIKNLIPQKPKFRMELI